MHDVTSETTTLPCASQVQTHTVYTQLHSSVHIPSAGDQLPAASAAAAS